VRHEGRRVAVVAHLDVAVQVGADGMAEDLGPPGDLAGDAPAYGSSSSLAGL
jgi:hypothetical protein